MCLPLSWSVMGDKPQLAHVMRVLTRMVGVLTHMVGALAHVMGVLTHMVGVLTHGGRSFFLPIWGGGNWPMWVLTHLVGC